MRIKSLILGTMLAAILIGCTESEADSKEEIVARLHEQIEQAEQEMADAMDEIRDNDGEISQRVERRIEGAREELEAIQRKLEALRREHRESSPEAERYTDGGASDDRERVRIRIDGDNDAAESDYDAYRDDSGYGDEDEYEHRHDRDFDIEIDIDEEDIERAISGVGETLAKLGEALNNQKGMTSVDRSDLKDLFPGEVAGMKRRNINSSTDGAFGISITTVEAEYEGQRTDLELSVIDLGSFGGLASDVLDKVDARSDRDSDDGYVKSADIEGYPAQIHFERNRRYDELTTVVMVEERFVVALKAEGTDLDERLIKDVLADFRLSRLAELAW